MKTDKICGNGLDYDFQTKTLWESEVFSDVQA